VIKTENIEEKIIKVLFENCDEKYRDFNASLIPNVPRENFIGVRTPALRDIAKNLPSDEADEFLKILPHKYYDENNLHGFLIEKIKDYDRVIYELDRFLPYVDNWATCDLVSPKILKKNLVPLYEKIKEWIGSGKTYTVRFGIEMLMSFYLDGSFSPEYPSLVASVRSDEYYVNMIIAWYFATALAKQYESILPFIEEKRLDVWVHNKAIQKACESYRVSDERKAYLKTLKIK